MLEGRNKAVGEYKVKVSVIVPIFNSEKYLEKCLNSIIGQTEKNIEILCVEDGSADRSWELLEEIGKKDERIHIWRNEENQGTAFTRNRGMDNASGEFITFVDPDDFIPEDAIEKMCVAAIERDLDLLYGDIKTISEFENYDMIEQTRIRKSAYEDSSGVLLFDRLVKNHEMIGAVYGLYRKSFIDENHLRFRNGIYHEDIAFTFKAILLCKRAGCIRSICYFYLRRKGSVTLGDKLEKRLEGLIIAYFDMLTFWNQYSDMLREIGRSIERFLESYYLTIKHLYKQLDSCILESPMLAYTKKKRLFIEEVPQNRIQILSCDLEVIRKCVKVVIYGAGEMARETLRYLNEKNVHVEAFIVTDNKQNPNAINNIPVLGTDSLVKMQGDTVIIIGVSKLYREEVQAELARIGNQKQVINIEVTNESYC